MMNKKNVGVANLGAALAATVAILLSACQQATPTAEPIEDKVVRPAFSLATDDAYDFDAIPTYLESHQVVYDHIDANLDAHLASIQRWLRQPSISAQNVGITDMAELVRQDLEDIGFSEAEIEKLQADGVVV